MKKGILVAGASVLLLSGLVAGVFAKYQTTLDNVGSGSVVAKDFAFVGESEEETSGIVKIAPGETVKLATITVKNFNDSITSEVDIKVRGFVFFSGDLFDGISEMNSTYHTNDSLTYAVTETTTEYTDGAFINTGFSLVGGKKVSRVFSLTATWKDSILTPSAANSYQNTLATKTAEWSVLLRGTQA